MPMAMRAVLSGVGLVEKRVSTTMVAVNPGMRASRGRVVKMPTTCGRVVESVASSPTTGLVLVVPSPLLPGMGKVLPVAST